MGLQNLIVLVPIGAQVRLATCLSHDTIFADIYNLTGAASNVICTLTLRNLLLRAVREKSTLVVLAHLRFHLLLGSSVWHEVRFLSQAAIGTLSSRIIRLPLSKKLGLCDPAGVLSKNALHLSLLL